MTRMLTAKYDSYASRIERRVDKAQRRVSFLQGGLLRKVARQQIRRRKRSSAAGESPSAHVSGGGGLKAIRFAVDGDSVIVGPVHKGSLESAVQPTGNDTVPSVLEFGGRVKVEVAKPPNSIRDVWRWQIANPDEPIPDGWIRSFVISKLDDRPFMRPALEKSQDKLIEFWRNSL
ncbi:MAG TPA: hypothetical protein DDW52_17055 [Planctomycetaceae bacterium]|nr:hypothetical protein [Planctomycetaceae bacterium]